MQSKRTRKLRSLLNRVLLEAGLSSAALFKSAHQVIVFGSHGSGSASGDSDLDVLCIGRGRGYKSKSLHIIWIEPKLLRDPIWLGSELATHVGSYGVWLKGSKAWTTKLVPDEQSVRRKQI